ncbi:hypothetical protein AMELA_G00249900 [Ameiurus melas]|uniref:Uncharacterized protein n=1 Tax=Ameiurus melas TaxID=219545 RepID=A0A7J5ZVS1_AMEME|nr:hypothetical protein AMELA_G00249900 [Ameiurus melas]
MAAVVNYSSPWWVNLLHRLPHFNLRFEQISSEFQPEDSSYQQVRAAAHIPHSLGRTAGRIGPGMLPDACPDLKGNAKKSMKVSFLYPETVTSSVPALDGTNALVFNQSLSI